jgi:hypothetical protein
MHVKVRCRCMQRTIDTDTVGPWRLRCKTCHEIIYDPQAASARAKKQPETSDEEKSQFNDWLQASNELKVLMSSDGETGLRPCPKHPKYKLIAACSGCEKLLCKKCLDRVGESFTCGDCVERKLFESRESGKTTGGLFAFLRRLFRRKK